MAAVVNSIPKLTNLWSTQLRCFHLSAFLSQIRVLTRPICTYSDYNPLLNQESLPRFKEIRPAHLAPAIEQLTKDFENDFIEFERTLKVFSENNSTSDRAWETVIEPLEKIGSQLSYAWGVASHLNGVRNGPELRTSYEKVQPLVVKVAMKARQSVPFYGALLRSWYNVNDTQTSTSSMEDQVDQSCFIPGFSVSFQKSFFYIINWFSPFTMLLSVWCVVSNATVIIALYRSGIKFIRPGLSMLCSLSITDLLWGATVAPVESGLRLKHLLNSQVCEMYSEFSKIPFISPPVVLYICTIFNLTIVSIDRFLAVKNFAQYRFWVTRRRAVVACVIVWLISITLGAVREQTSFRFDPFAINSLAVGIIILPAIVVIICQSMTIYCLRRHNNKVVEMRDQGIYTNSANTVNAAIERKLSKTTAYVVGVLALVFFPIAIGMIMTSIIKKQYLKLVNPALIPLATICSSINPILYYRENRRVRVEILKIIKC